MKLTEKKAIEICIELWTWLAKTGKRKSEWDGWGDDCFYQDCPFCEYSSQMGDRGCESCPIIKSFQSYCVFIGFGNWYNAETVLARKKYAKLFLAKLKEIK